MCGQEPAASRRTGRRAGSPRNRGGSPSGVRQPPMLADQEDEEDHDEGAVLAARVGPQQRPDHQHRRAGRADPGGERGADRQQGRVDGRRAPEGAAQQDPARHGVERPEQDEEGDVVRDDDVQDLVQRRPAVDGNERDREGRRPEGGDLAVVVVPERGRERAARARSTAACRRTAGRLQRGSTSPSRAAAAAGSAAAAERRVAQPNTPTTLTPGRIFIAGPFRSTGSAAACCGVCGCSVKASDARNQDGAECPNP